jgi:exosortase D (VPLPA-CTERM-specific)
MSEPHPSTSTRTQAPWQSAGVLALAAVAILVVAFWDSIVWMTKSWDVAEYSHCWLIAPIALFLVANRGRELQGVVWKQSWLGVALVVLGFLMLVLGELSAIYTIGQYGFVIAVWGVALALLGGPAVRGIWPALAYLIFLVPLPDFVEVKLSADLQLISSKLGVGVIRIAGLPVYLEGNVIDLGNYQLAVAEACNGLRYLFPLMSFGFLCAVLFQAPWWQRTIIFLSSIPITVLMNSFRIGVIGILVNYLGIEHAEGFIHYFEGWVVFMMCVGILFLEMWLMSLASRRRLLKSLRMETLPLRELSAMFSGHRVTASLASAAAAVVAGTALAAGIEHRPELIPQGRSLAAFPLVIDEWHGTEQRVDERVLTEGVKADEALMATYARSAEPIGVSLWLAYYASQRSGRSVHSPKTCLPGGGWEIRSFEERLIPEVRAGGESLPVNRVVIGLEEQQQLVYYWFAQRGRVVTNEYLVKSYIFWDALTRNRTDGSLVRISTPVIPGPDGIEGADRRLQDFVRAMDPKLNYFLPQADAVLQVAATD